jgi:hypothetical protein
MYNINTRIYKVKNVGCLIPLDVSETCFITKYNTISPPKQIRKKKEIRVPNKIYGLPTKIH